MRILDRLAICTLTCAALAVIPQSAIESAVRSPHSGVTAPAVRIPKSAMRASAVRTPQSAMSPWRTLFDGTSLDAWRGYKGAAIPSGWKIENRTLAFRNIRVREIR